MLSKTAEYALRAIASLAEMEGSSVPADELARKTMIPRRYLQRVLKDLSEAGMIESRPGPGGGYELAVDTQGVTLLDVVNAVSPIERIRECPLGRPEHVQLCPLHRELDRAYAGLEAALGAMTIRALLEADDEGRSGPFCPGGEGKPVEVKECGRSRGKGRR